MRLDNASRVLLAAHTSDGVIGLGVVDGPVSDRRGRYRIGYLRAALHKAMVLSGAEDPDQASVRIMFSEECDPCLVLCVEDTHTCVLVAPRSDTEGDDE